VEGHCDERGTPEYNLALGERRASAARDYMVSLGVGADRLQTISYGEERPVCQDSDESCWSRNRRAHPTVTGRNNG
jgi:peptidoglycan-associated lipoprotein